MGLSPELTATFTVYALGTVVLGLFLSAYVVFEIKTHGIALIMQNKYVRQTLLAASSFLVSMICYTILDFTTLPRTAELQILAGAAFSFSVSMHVTLIYMRSQDVFASSLTYTKLVKGVLICLLVSSFFAVVFGAAINYSNNSLVFALYAVAALITALLSGGMHVISTVSFVRYVRAMNAHLRKHISAGSTNQLGLTDVIAKRSIRICWFALMSVTFFWLQFVVSYPSELSLRIVQLIQQFFYMTTLILWMSLKVELDLIQKRNDKFAQPLIESGQLVHESSATIN
eukprot:TRINITY_DN3159_c1_g1_i1.p1 TRINITY_DN3159_c1_g1~~TRINITY_DN3159_c1_g1_i1.p1  ORF type:complete len:286 (+),score=47.90 TRINITY_DN3159_c1_g1_i1:47-904(+)